MATNDDSGGTSARPSHDAHQAMIVEQFSRQAELFARLPALHSERALSLLVEAGEPCPGDETLDVACGPGTVVTAFARVVRRSVGLDATPAMLEQARRLSAQGDIGNVEWHAGDIRDLPFTDNSFDIVSCRFAFHHLHETARALAEMVRVCRPNGRVVLCDGLASDDPAKAAALNRMEKHRDPSTVEFRPLAYLLSLYAAVGLPTPSARYYQVPTERELLVSVSFPVDGDRAGLRRMIDASVDGDTMGLNARREGDTVRFGYPAVILAARKRA